MPKHLTRRESLLLPAVNALGHARSLTEGKEVHGTLGVVAAEPPDAVRAGARLLLEGGNAMDAAAAACIAACMLEPHSVDIGGYVMGAVVLEGKTGKVWAVDADSVSPAAARENMFEVLPKRPVKTLNENEYHCSVRDNANVYGPLAVGVPGTLGGIGKLWEKWGRAKWSAVLEPSLALLDRGFRFEGVAAAIRGHEPIIRRWDYARQHLMPDNRLPKPDDRWHRRDMEKTLARLSRHGWRDLYEGDLARSIVNHVRGLGGILTLEDMKAFEPRVAEPYETTFRGTKVFMAPLANGGITLGELLNMWESLDRHQPDDPLYWHQLAETGKLAWRDRLQYLGDPAKVRVDVKKFLDKAYAARRVEALRKNPRSIDRLPAPSANASPGTVNLTTADAEGNMVAVTISHGGAFGSCLAVPGTGITLGHGMCRFDPRPGRPNSVGPRKRPMNNICPTILRLKDRDVACGQRGGRRIVSVVSQICRRMVEENASGLEAVNAPRLHIEEQAPFEVTRTLDPKIVAELREMGHEVRVVAAVGGHANVVERLSTGKLRGAGNVWAAGVDA